jgi:murein DD-endopeptidase MepM/ murein hydrolase activator NlpD
MGGLRPAVRVRQTPAVPRQHFPTSRRRRVRPVRAAIAGLATAIVLVVAVPATAPRGSVLDIVSDQVGPAAVTGAEPSPAVASPGPPAPAAAAPVAFRDPRRPYLAGPIEPGVENPARGAPAGAPSIESLTGYVWPIAHPRLTLPFGPTPWGSLLSDGGRFHDGVDIATFCGDRIMATHDGTVLSASRHFDKLLGWIGDLGPYFRRLDRNHLWFELPIVVVIDDGNGYRSVYAHFEKVKVHPGQVVHAGQLLGFEGATGHATGCHLHYGLFSPAETATFTLRGDIAKRMKLPRHEIARIDPLKVLPYRRGMHQQKGGHATGDAGGA